MLKAEHAIHHFVPLSSLLFAALVHRVLGIVIRTPDSLYMWHVREANQLNSRARRALKILLMTRWGAAGFLQARRPDKWDEYAKARAPAKDKKWFRHPGIDVRGPERRDDSFWTHMRRFYVNDPLPTLQTLLADFKRPAAGRFRRA